MSIIQKDLFHRMDEMSQALMELTGQSCANPTATVPLQVFSNMTNSASAMAQENIRLQPEPFHGDVEACGGFLLQCQLIFLQAPGYYQSDHSKVTLIVNSLRSKTLQWVQAFLSSNPISHVSFDWFIGEFQLVFDQPRKEEATCRLLSLKQQQLFS